MWAQFLDRLFEKDKLESFRSTKGDEESVIRQDISKITWIVSSYKLSITLCTKFGAQASKVLSKSAKLCQAIFQYSSWLD